MTVSGSTCPLLDRLRRRAEHGCLSPLSSEKYPKSTRGACGLSGATGRRGSPAGAWPGWPPAGDLRPYDRGSPLFDRDEERSGTARGKPGPLMGEPSGPRACASAWTKPPPAARSWRRCPLRRRRGRRRLRHRAAPPAADVDTPLGLEFTGQVPVVPEGRIVLAGEPLLEVTAPLPQAQVETYVLSQVTSPTASDTASRKRPCPGRPVTAGIPGEPSGPDRTGPVRTKVRRK